MNRHTFVEGNIKEKAAPKPKKTKLDKSLPRHIVNGKDLASETIRQAALNILADEEVAPRPRRRRRRASTPRRNVTAINRRLMPPAVVCMTGIGPDTRSNLIELLEEHGYTYTTNPANAQILVFNPEQTARESVKFRNARRNPDVAMVPYDTFFRGML